MTGSVSQNTVRIYTLLTKLPKCRDAIGLPSLPRVAGADFVRSSVESGVSVLLVYKRSGEIPALRYVSTFALQNCRFLKWAMLGSNQRPLPREGSEAASYAF